MLVCAQVEDEPKDSLETFLDAIGTQGCVSLLQKAIRRRPAEMEHPETGNVYRTQDVMEQVVRQACRGRQIGFFLPCVGRFVSPLQHLLRTLFVSAAKDSEYSTHRMFFFGHEGVARREITALVSSARFLGRSIRPRSDSFVGKLHHESLRRNGGRLSRDHGLFYQRSRARADGSGRRNGEGSKDAALACEKSERPQRRRRTGTTSARTRPLGRVLRPTRGRSHRLLSSSARDVVRHHLDATTATTTTTTTTTERLWRDVGANLSRRFRSQRASRTTILF